MLFSFIKAYARFAIKIYCRRIIVDHPEWLTAKGPLLLACNHPNSFLDGIILTTLFNETVYSLARGDVFQKPQAAKVLRWMRLLPVYRTSEGVENLEYNYDTFEACKEVFRNNGVVIIFSEGRCINEWHLRPLKKGTARLAISAWEEGIDLTVLPVGLNYSPFRVFGKTLYLLFGKPLNRASVLEHRSDGKMFLSFNEQLQKELKELVFEIDPSDNETLAKTFFVPQPFAKKVLLSLPALMGWLLHAPLYVAAKGITQAYFNNDHFDSVVVSLLLLSYPFYLLFFFWLAALFGGWMAALSVFILLPFMAWSYVQLKSNLHS